MVWELQLWRSKKPTELSSKGKVCSTWSIIWRTSNPLDQPLTKYIDHSLSRWSPKQTQHTDNSLCGMGNNREQSSIQSYFATEKKSPPLAHWDRVHKIPSSKCHSERLKTEDSFEEVKKKFWVVMWKSDFWNTIVTRDRENDWYPGKRKELY